MSRKDFIRQQTIPFICALYQCEPEEAKALPLTLQYYADSAEAKLNPFTPRSTTYGSLRELVREILHHNRIGCGVSLAINPTFCDRHGDGLQKTIVAAYVDLDRKLASEQTTPEELIEDGFTIVNKTGHGLHGYLVLRNPIKATPENIERMTRVLYRLYEVYEGWGADPQVRTVAKVMRLPGIFNMKQEPILAEMVAYNPDAYYTMEELEDSYPYTGELEQKLEFCASATGLQSSCSLKERLRLALEELESYPIAEAGHDGSITTLGAARLCFRYGLTEEQTLELLQLEYNPFCLPPWDDVDLERKVYEASSWVQNHGMFGCSLPDVKDQRKRMENLAMLKAIDLGSKIEVEDAD